MPNNPIILTAKGINVPIIKQNDCFEKKPEFLIEYLSRYTTPVKIKI